MDTMPVPMTFDFLRAKCEEWRALANKYVFAVVALGLITIASSVFVSVFTGSSPTEIHPMVLKGIACLSTTLLTIITAFGLVQKSNDIRNAWRILQIALSKYSEGIYSLDQLIADYKKGEDLMGATSFNYGTPERHEPKDMAEQKDINMRAIMAAKTAKDSAGKSEHALKKKNNQLVTGNIVFPEK